MSATESREGDQDSATPLLTPRDGIPEVIADDRALERAVQLFAAGTGPVAIDAERASGYRYSQRAYLVQLRRQNAGTALIDPIACSDLSALDDALADTEWVLHAATQDLPCLAELGMRPRRLFDTELAGRLLSLPKVGLAPLVHQMLGYHLEKGYSAADWSTRPLPQAWLNYAALDVEVLVELRNALAERLDGAGKIEWAGQEFQALCSFQPAETRPDPWRRTSGIHRVRNRRDLAYVRELWNARERIARARDIAPGRIIPDRAIIAVALAKPASRTDLANLDGFDGRYSRRDLPTWWEAAQRARKLSDAQLPEQSVSYDGPPPARAWADRAPEAAARLSACREALQEVAATNELPVENLLAPDTVRRLAWQPPNEPTLERVTEQLRLHRARDWQIALAAGPLTDALADGPAS